MAKKYRVGIIGRTGKGNYGHGLDTVWRQIPQVTVAAVADDNPNGLKDAVKRTGAATGYADYREMLDREKLDIVGVCQRWIDQHHPMVMACAEHGCHVYMEKPFCPNLTEGDEIVRALEMRHLKLAIAHTNRYSPQVAVVKRLIANGEIGDVLELRARGKEDPRRGGGEDLWVLGTHMLDLMRVFAGDVQSCYATVKQDGRPVVKSDVADGNEGIGPLAGDTIDAMFQFPKAMVGYWSSHRGKAQPPSRFGIRILGSKGVIELQSNYMSTAYLLRDHLWSPGRTGSQWIPISSNGPGEPETRKDASHNGGNVAAVNDLISAIENDRQPISSVYDALAATEMIAGIFESHRVKGPVAFPLENRRNPLTMLEG